MNGQVRQRLGRPTVSDGQYGARISAIMRMSRQLHTLSINKVNTPRPKSPSSLATVSAECVRYVGAIQVLGGLLLSVRLETFLSISAVHSRL